MLNKLNLYQLSILRNQENACGEIVSRRSIFVTVFLFRILKILENITEK